MKQQSSKISRTPFGVRFSLNALGIAAICVAAASCGDETGALDPSADVVNVETALVAGMTPVDNFDDGDVSDWKAFSDSASTMSHRISSSRAQNGLTCMKLTYAISPSGYAGVERSAGSTGWNWSGASGVGVSVYGLGTSHKLLMQVYDAGGERWETSVIVSWSGWRDVSVPFSSFRAAAWQPSSARADQVFDRAGVRGLALIPARGGQSGSVYLDALGLTGGSATTPTPSTSTPASATIVPLYSYPTNPAWAAIVTAKKNHPAVPVVAVVNPSNGPGSSMSSTFASAIKTLSAAGIKVAGYVATSYGARPSGEVQADLQKWKSFYPEVTAIFFDEQSNVAGFETKYQQWTAYARSLGMTYTIGNPGADSRASYIGSVDTMLIYESAGLPSISRIAGWHAEHPRHNFGIIPYAVPSLDSTFVAQAEPYVGYIFLQNDLLPNPWDTLPGYFDSLLRVLE